MLGGLVMQSLEPQEEKVSYVGFTYGSLLPGCEWATIMNRLPTCWYFYSLIYEI